MTGEIMSIADQMMGYTPATFKTNSSLGPFIEYNVFDPIGGGYVRKRLRLKRMEQKFEKKSDFRSYVNQVIVTVNCKLSAGWTPFGETHDVREYTALNMALQSYIADRRKELRKASLVSYESVINILINWLKEQKIESMASNQFVAQHARRFMDYLLARPKFNNNTYNTYLKKYRVCWNWLIEHGYSKENAFEKIRTRLKETKQRGLIPVEARKKVIEYVRKSKEPEYELVLHLVFYSLIRPAEIERIRVRDVNLTKSCIHISEDQAKTHYERYAPLSDETIKLLLPLLEGRPQNWYLVGPHFVPSERPAYHGLYKKRWMKIRKHCELPNDMQLYSFKDSGITELLHANIDPLTVMNAADHHDLSTTTRYAKHPDDQMISTIKAADITLS